ncbi:dihydropteroate synthase DhpS [Treponema primitia ZAS-2]|uniref:Dihydropteroate synthase DhpS n=1 Tax=Treponema primitia (strain ATCC BAA-887 / DSM 12427 / ZAS-2) TaxID=545694 RepID=F5YMP1_TREPZ|nr:carbon monoxide dehydrogenase/acetyl-CoA synthase methytransferase subunit [Treponema primitia]AEF85965.1 dihydropteroate synthase DhpS [Treponema primitia ZAS-2]
MGKFIVIGERIHCISPAIKAAMETRDPEPIKKRAKEQLDAGATYLDLNIGPAEKGGEELMQWGVKLLQENFDNVPIALDTANKKAIEAGIKVYNRSKGKPIVNSADAGDRISYIDVAAANDAIVIALASKAGVPSDNEERQGYVLEMLEYGMNLGMDAADLWFDPLFLVIKGMQEKQQETLQFISWLAEQGFNSTGGLSNVSNMMPKTLRPIVDSFMVAMCISHGLTSAIVNPCDKQLMQGIKTADIIMNQSLFSDSYLEL